MKRMLAMLICAAALAAGQTATGGGTLQPAAEKPKYLQSVIEVKNGEVNALASLLKMLQPNMTTVAAHPDLKLISIGTYDPEFVKLADEIVKRYDVAREQTPPKVFHDIEVTAYILAASPQGTAGDALPADLEGVAKQLRAVFGYRDLKLLDSALIRTHENHGSNIRGSVTGLTESLKMPSIYQLRFKSASISTGEKQPSISLSDFSFDFRLAYQNAEGHIDFNNIAFSTDLSIPESQKVVVGKSKIGSGDQALVLVLTARVVN